MSLSPGQVNDSCWGLSTFTFACSRPRKAFGPENDNTTMILVQAFTYLHSLLDNQHLHMST
jgi:hypothetical protein